MTATRIAHHATTWEVIGQSMDCSRAAAGCEYTTEAKKRHPGQPCPRCGQGVLERCRYRVETTDFDAVGSCDCHDFRIKKRPTLEHMLAATRRLLPQAARQLCMCKHIKFVRTLQGRGDALDALLLAVPQAKEHGP